MSNVERLRLGPLRSAYTAFCQLPLLLCEVATLRYVERVVGAAAFFPNSRCHPPPLKLRRTGAALIQPFDPELTAEGLTTSTMMLCSFVSMASPTA